MQIVDEIILHNFKPWSGAISVFNRLTTEEIDTLEEILIDSGQILSSTEINDIFWFEDEWICEVLGIDHEEFWEREA